MFNQRLPRVCFITMIGLVLAASNPYSIADPAPVLALEWTAPDTETRNANGGLLIRELFRQALLNCARDQFGLRTRDEVLFEEMSDKRVAAVERLKLFVSASQTEGIRLRLLDEADAVRWELTLSITDDDLRDYTRLVALAHRVERQEYPAALIALGHAPRPAPAAASAPAEMKVNFVPDAVEQFVSLRAAHAAVSEAPENAAALTALAAGYAHLSAMHGYTWDLSTKVFAARALLYAERLHESLKGAAPARAARAYARAWAGLHATALDDLAAIDAASLAAGSDIDAMAQISAALSRYDYAALEGLSKRRWRAAPMVRLALLEARMPDLHTRPYLWAAENLAEAAPVCMRALDVLVWQGGIGEARFYTPRMLGAIAEQISAADLRSRGGKKWEKTSPLRASDDEYALVPPVAPKQLRAIREEGSTAKDVGEPSWGVLAHLMEESLFLACFRQVDMLERKWGVNPEPALSHAAGLCADHRFVAMFRVMVKKHTITQDERDALLSTISFRDCGFNLGAIYKAFETAGPQQQERWKKAAWAMYHHGDETATDLQFLYDTRRDDRYRSHFSKALLRVSPLNPFGGGTDLYLAGPAALDDHAKWTDKFGKSPQYRRILAEQFESAERWDGAIEQRQELVNLVPTVSSYRALASAYKRAGKTDLWMSTLERSLQPDVEEGGLERSGVQIQLADWYVERKQFEKAIAFAEAAAVSGSGQSMWCAVRAHRAAGNWQQSERWVREISERYDTSIRSWFNWCVMYGRGDRKAAAQLVIEFLAKNPPIAAIPLDEAGVFYLTARELEKAKTTVTRCFDRFANPFAGMLLFTMLLDAGDAAGARALLPRVEKAAETFTYPNGEAMKEYGELAAILTANWENPDEAKIQAVIAKAKPGRQANIAYILATREANLGRKEQAIEWLKTAAAYDKMGFSGVLLARVRLEELGVAYESKAALEETK